MWGVLFVVRQMSEMWMGDFKDCSQPAGTVAAGDPDGRQRSSYQASYYRDFLRAEMRDSHDMLRQKPTFLFILLGWS
jgi:hypothetical protein